MCRQSDKNLLSSNISSTCPHNMVNFGPLAAEIISLVWGTPANFSGFRVLAALLHCIYSSGRQPNFAALNRGRHLHSAGRPPRWALAHISSYYYYATRKMIVMLNTEISDTRHILVVTVRSIHHEIIVIFDG